MLIKVLRPVLIVIFLIIVSQSTKAVELEVKQPCEENPIFKNDIPFAAGDSVGKLTTHTFLLSDISFSGSSLSIAQINNIPTAHTKQRDLEDGGIRFYGWCYSVNNKMPDVMPGKFLIFHSFAKIKWFLGYADLSKSGEFSSYCAPVLNDDPFCKSL